MYQYRIVQDYNNMYAIQRQENCTWEDMIDYVWGVKLRYSFLWLAKRKLHSMVRREEKEAEYKAYVSKVVYGPYP